MVRLRCWPSGQSGLIAPEKGESMTETDMPRLLRLKQIVGDPKSDPPIEPIIPISKSTWWEGVKSGRYPKAIKMSANTTVWREDEVRALVDKIIQTGR